VVEPIFNRTSPDSPLTAEILQRASEEQQARLARLGDIMAQGAGAPWTAVPLAEESFLGGRELARREAMEDQRSQALSKQMTAQDLANQARGLSISEEQQRQHMLDSPLSGDTSANAKTMRQRLGEAEVGGAEAQTRERATNASYAKSINEAKLKADSELAAQAHANTQSIYSTLKDESARRDLDQLTTALVGINANLDFSAPEQQKQAQDLVASFQAHHPGLDSHYAQGVLNGTAQLAQQRLAQIRAAKDQLETNSLPYQTTVLPALVDTNKKLTALQSLGTLINNYRNNVALKTGQQGYTIDTGVSQAFLHNFANQADNFDPNNPSSVGTAAVQGLSITDPKSVLQKMQDVYDSLAEQAQTQWKGQQTGFGELGRRPEIRGIDQRFQALRTPGGATNPKRAIGQAQGAPSPGQTASIMQRPPIGGGNATASPFGAPAPAVPQPNPQPQVPYNPAYFPQQGNQ
jgi:hypothetical protein